MFTDELEHAILETLAYSDIFDYPLRLDELYSYLPIRTEIEQMSRSLESLNGQVGKNDGYYFLTDREIIVEIRKQRITYSYKFYQHALMYGQILGSLPFIRMVALTGSLAVMNSSTNADFDYMLIAAPGRVWMARGFALLLNRLSRLFGHTLCPNLIVSESSLTWSTHDLYSAHELYQMIPIAGMDVYLKLMKANPWAEEFFPNGFKTFKSPNDSQALFQKIFETPLRGKVGDHIERWEMKRKIMKLSKQSGFGKETLFNAEVCQGNFGHHNQRTNQALQERLRQYINAKTVGEETNSDHERNLSHQPAGVQHDKELI